MCGIAGIFNLDGMPVSPVALRKMTDAVAHRGPDGEGFFIDSFLGLGHRRLAIIDLSPAGHQPRVSSCGNFAITFNGEIYNFRELRKTLEVLGHVFTSRTDTEVALHAYIEWGPDCVERFNGMFAFALWDKTRASLFLARDRYGVKPLYYTFVGNAFFFGSEQKAVLADSTVARELDLEALGHVFTSRTDTEVALHAYIEWGPNCVERFNGMFAFALWDKTRASLFLARDRYGVKPLYYAFAGNAFLFGSEQKAILADSTVRRELDLEALLEYFTFQNIFTDKTLLKGIRLFPAGCRALLPLGSASGALKIERYWDFDFREPEIARTEDEYAEELDFLFRQAVKRQLVSDVDVGAYLSGGMDSGSITAVAAKELPYMKTFTCGFDLNSASGLELGFDEREKAEYMSYLFKTEHYEMVLKAGDMERVMPRLAWHLEEPRVGQSYPNFYAAQLASKFVKVVLSGGGGDELFGGYPWRYYRAAVCTNFDDYIDRYYGYWQRLASNSTLKELFKPVWDQVKHVWTRDIFKSVFERRDQAPCSPEEYINHSLYFEAKTFLHGLLVVEDKLSSAHALETRVPFLDNDLVDFAMRLPVRMKLRNLDDVVRINENEPGSKQSKYFQKTNDGKNLLRRVMRRHIPDQITGAQKQGFSAPDASWFKGESMEYVRRTLMGENARIFEYMDKGVLRSLVEEHLGGVQNRRLLVWSLLNVEEVIKRFSV